METETDALTGSESLTIDQAAAAYSKAMAPKEVPADQSKVAAEPDESDDTTDDELQAPDEDVSEEDDGATADEEQADDAEEEGSEPPDTTRIRLPDGTFSTLGEVKAGTLRQRDYTQKTQEVAEQRKAVEAQSAAIKASEEQLQSQRELVITLVKNIIPPQPDPRKADPRDPAYDPAGYQADEVAFRQWANYLTQLETDQQRTVQERQAQAAEQSKEKVAKEWTQALEVMPQLKDPKKLESFGKDTLKYGAIAGYTPQELAVIHHDHRQLVVMDGYVKWMKLQASQEKVAKKVEGRPPVIKGGKRLNPSESQSRRASDAIATAQKTGREADVAAAYHASRKRN